MASVAKRADGQWRARYRDASGQEHAKHSHRKVDAQRWLDEVTAAVVARFTWETPERNAADTVELVFSDEGQPWSRQNFGREWHRGLRPASDCPKHRETERDRKADCTCLAVDFHELRHVYASLLIRHGESVKTVQARLGHASAAETLDTYSLLSPDLDDRTREAVDAPFGIPADSLRTKGATWVLRRRPAAWCRRAGL